MLQGVSSVRSSIKKEGMDEQCVSSRVTNTCHMVQHEVKQICKIRYMMVKLGYDGFECV